MGRYHIYFQEKNSSMHTQTKKMEEPHPDFSITVCSTDFDKMRSGEIKIWDYVSKRLHGKILDDSVIIFTALEFQNIAHSTLRQFRPPDHYFIAKENDDEEHVNTQIKVLGGGDVRLIFRTAICMGNINLAEKIRKLRNLDVNSQTYSCQTTGDKRDSNILEDSIFNGQVSVVDYLLRVGAHGDIFSVFAYTCANTSVEDERIGEMLHLLASAKNYMLDLNAEYSFKCNAFVPKMSIGEFLTCGRFTAMTLFPYVLLDNKRVDDLFQVMTIKHNPKIEERTTHRCFSLLVFIVMYGGYRIETNNMPGDTRDAINALQWTMSENLPKELMRHISYYLM